jgi:hypothetical protein
MIDALSSELRKSIITGLIEEQLEDFCAVMKVLLQIINNYDKEYLGEF